MNHSPKNIIRLLLIIVSVASGFFAYGYSYENHTNYQNSYITVDRVTFNNIINDIGRNSDSVVQGTFRGQGSVGISGASVRGDVLFRIKGNDVVVTTLQGSYITILKDGVLNNSSVRNAIAISRIK